ncbi:hypothetical protein BD626DRAFT_146097 [Schizophyllum amplum]|uniref:F-box domain-containing protein n=1 Tax=Schizophyllum amplum TaxID=97359 RepID=A0A550C573_9AGAR|nr:hypothetical protein BD626DRAFT_146097 [Auriculariopsis ampla]
MLHESGRSVHKVRQQTPTSMATKTWKDSLYPAPSVSCCPTNVRHITFGRLAAEAVYDTALKRLLISPLLKAVNLDLRRQYDHLRHAPLLSLIAGRCQLNKLVISADELSDDITYLMNAVVVECKQLEVVEVPSMDRKTVAILAASPCIRSLTLKGSRRSPCIDGDLLAQTTEAGFSALRCLRLSFCSVDDCVWMAKMMLRSPIQILDVSACPSPTTSWQELFQQLQSAIARSSHVRLRFSDALMAGKVATTSIKAADLEPLFYFENVTSLLISFVKDLRPDNALLKKIADNVRNSPWIVLCFSRKAVPSSRAYTCRSTRTIRPGCLSTAFVTRLTCVRHVPFRQPHRSPG